MPQLDFYKIGYLAAYAKEINLYPMGFMQGYLAKQSDAETPGHVHEACKVCGKTECTCGDGPVRKAHVDPASLKDNPGDQGLEGETEPGIPKGIHNTQLKVKHTEDGVETQPKAKTDPAMPADTSDLKKSAGLWSKTRRTLGMEISPEDEALGRLAAGGDTNSSALFGALGTVTKDHPKYKEMLAKVKSEREASDREDGVKKESALDQLRKLSCSNMAVGKIGWVAKALTGGKPVDANAPTKGIPQGEHKKNSEPKGKTAADVAKKNNAHQAAQSSVMHTMGDSK